MKNLKDILQTITLTELTGTDDIVITSLTLDSRKVMKGSLFIAIPGTQLDGHAFIGAAIGKGAAAIVCESLPENLQNEITYIRLQNPAAALGVIASNFYNKPSQKLKLVGITGTNGKTTTATLLFNLFKDLGYKTGLLSTILYQIDNESFTATHTTPDAIRINELLHQMVEAGCDFAFMEVSSHAIDQHRISGLTFSGGVFTNLTHDHLDYHTTFKEYLTAKKKFFDQLPETAFALSNADDKNGRVMLQNTRASKHFYSLKTMAGFKGRIIENHFDGLQMNIDNREMFAMLPGTFNAYNLLAVYGTAVLLGQDKEEILTGISRLHGAEGRFETLKSKMGITAIVDYAHTPDALENVLKTINSLRTFNEKLISVVGAGGDRDKTKRPKMARIVSVLSDTIILTSDNPRSEDPEQIIQDMMSGIDPAKKNKTMLIVNRNEAIKTAVNLARPGDLILVAGKGHEKYQEVMGVKHPFDDKKVLMELLETV
ncbi:MAG: UDP-N-acetylmuramoyl-L-alanyl-D-glutamate--2,6-diaminopimelate ligase [Bacteroidales bacterium]|nr:UDP-N-acetylmuramoyl-L-alanyl-D-glutamate--2,6-diaminopimelate ligase [Bacteroidales bacterium]